MVTAGGTREQVVPSGMATIELHTGLPGSDRHNQIMDVVTSHGDATVWWLVDEMRRAERTEQRLCDRQGGVLTGVEVLVTGRLALHILNESGRSVPTVDVEVRRLLLRDLLASSTIQAQVSNELGPGWARRIEEFYARFEEERFLGPRQDRQSIESLLTQRYPWALDLLQAYERRIEEAGLIDEETLPRIACEWMEGGAFSPPDLLVVDRLGPLRPSQLEVLHRLADQAERTLVLQDESEGSGGGLALARQDAERWRARHSCTTIEHRSPERSVQLAHHLFAAPGTAQPDSPSHTATLRHHLDRAAEVRAVAAEVSRLVHDEQVPDDEIAVVCTSLSTYAPHVDELFGRYGLRADVRLGQPLSSSPVARLMVALFALRAEGISREGITDVLLNPYVRYGTQFTDHGRVLAFDTAARRARIVDGRDGLKSSWLEPFRAELERMREQVNLLQKEDEGGQDLEEGDREGSSPEVKRERIEKRLAWLERALEEFTHLANRILALPDPCTVEEALAWLRDIQRTLDVRSRVHRMARRDPERGQRDVLALGHLELTLDHIATTLRLQGRSRWPVSKFTELMQLAINSSRLRAGRRLHGGVPVMGPLDLRGLRVKHLFFLGLTASTWPRSPGIDLADPFASTWSDVDRLAESHALTLEAFFAGDEVHLSTPCPARGEGDEAPSPLLDELASSGVRVEEATNDETHIYRSALELMPEVGRSFASEERDRVLNLLATAAGQQSNEAILWARIPLVAAVETQRQDPTSLTRYEGMLEVEGVGGRVTETVTSRPWSASRLDTYATCPMKFLFGNVLKLEGVEEVEDEMDAASLGSLVHEILAKGTLRLQALRGGPVVFSDHPDEVARVMDEVADEVLEQFPYDNLYWRMIVHSVRSGLTEETDFPGYLRRVIDRHGLKKDLIGEAIYHVEAGFGLETGEGEEQLFAEPIRITVDGVTVPLAGRIDRISLHPDKGWRIWDYKVTKNNPSSKTLIAGGRSFQLPLYFWALEELRDSGQLALHEFDRSSYFITNHEGNPSLPTIWYQKDHVQDSEQLKRRVVEVDSSLKAGRFHHPLSQNDKLCPDSDYSNYCPFKDVCRRDHSLFKEREEKLDPGYLKDAYILGFQERLAERADAQGGEA